MDSFLSAVHLSVYGCNFGNIYYYLAFSKNVPYFEKRSIFTKVS